MDRRLPTHQDLAFGALAIVRLRLKFQALLVAHKSSPGTLLLGNAYPTFVRLSEADDVIGCANIPHLVSP